MTPRHITEDKLKALWKATRQRNFWLRRDELPKLQHGVEIATEMALRDVGMIVDSLNFDLFVQGMLALLDLSWNPNINIMQFIHDSMLSAISGGWPHSWP